jgi:hypothetical protein
MDAGKRPAGPLSSLFAGSEAAKVIDFLLSNKERHQTIPEIHTGTRASKDTINKIIGNLLDIDVVGIGARRVQDPSNSDKSKDENTCYIRDDTDTGKSIKDLWYHLMQVQTKNF